ncbi:Tll0287-like domain-containing protein [Pseudoalteromonas rubra]|nr:DUF3365 domain-containing protein [Pseudoalteromonas rubra]
MTALRFRSVRLSISFLCVACCILPATGYTSENNNQHSIEQSIDDVARTYHASLLYIFSQQKLINSTQGNKSRLFGSALTDNVKETYRALFAQDFPSREDKYINLLLKHMVLVMEDNRTLLLDEHISYKGFIPAIFAFQLSTKFRERGYGINIKFTNVRSRIRNTLSAPDQWEQQALNTLVKDQNSIILDSKASYQGQPAVRYMRPVRMTPLCLNCHGRPKDNPVNNGLEESQWQTKDRTGFYMEGWKLGELGGGISVVIYGENVAGYDESN